MFEMYIKYSNRVYIRKGKYIISCIEYTHDFFPRQFRITQ